MNDDKNSHKLILPDKVYDLIKFMQWWVLPELVILYALGAAMFKWPNVEFVTAVLGAVMAVSGGLAAASSANYYKVKAERAIKIGGSDE